MRRHTAWLLLAVMALFAALLSIPTTKAERPTSGAATHQTEARRDAVSSGPLRSTASWAKPLAGAVQDKVTTDNAVGLPSIMNSRSALSAALITTAGDRADKFSEIHLLADWDGREDFNADREQMVDNFVPPKVAIDVIQTRAAISAHTVANGFAENVYYYGDTAGNLWVGTDTNPGVIGPGVPAIDVLRQINIPALINTNTSGGFTLLNPQAGDCANPQITITGIAVNPVADLSDFDPSNASCGVIGELVYVSVVEPTGCATDGMGQPFRTRIFAFAFVDGVGAGAMTPAGTPATVRQLLRSPLTNAGGVAVDDDGSLYFHLASQTGTPAGAIFKATETIGNSSGCLAMVENPRVNRAITNIPGGATGFGGTLSLSLSQSSAITDNGDAISQAGERVRLTNYSGSSATFGNIAAITAAPDNIIYAAVSRSFVSGDAPSTQSTEGPFTNPVALGATPSMIISFADTTGAFDSCSTPDPLFAGTIKLKNGIADSATGLGGGTPGVNNFRVFALGTGPDIRNTPQGAAIGVTSTTLKVAMQIDPTIHNGIAVDEEGTVFVISGGTPAGGVSNPSPTSTEILAFPDCCVKDRRADFIDLRGDSLGGNVGDGDSDRFDHVFWQAPIDAMTGGPFGAAGLARGFLRYTNRLAPGPMGTGVDLGVTQRVQGDDATTDVDSSDLFNTSGTILFQALDPGHQVSGGDDQNPPFRGDDNDGAGTPSLAVVLEGGFEFVFGGPVGAANSVWNGFFLNSNGNITFGNGDTDNSPTIPEFRADEPRIAAAWTDINSAARSFSRSSFPVQALGFAGVNAFKVRTINAPEFSKEICSGHGGNTFATTLYDDGHAQDENENQALDPADPTGDNLDPAFDEQEGPNDLRFVTEPNTGVRVGERVRAEGEGVVRFDYSQMLILGEESDPVIVGISLGGLAGTNPPGLCKQNLSEAARLADTSPFGVIQSQTASVLPCLIGEGTEPVLYEFFNTATSPSLGSGGEVILGRPSFDLRAEGNDAVASKSAFQTDANRDHIGLYGVGSLPPPNPSLVTVVNGPFDVAPDQQPPDLINALGEVTLNLVGTGFFPNEVTTICEGNPPPENANPTERPGKTVSTAVTLACDVNGDSIPEAAVALGSVTPVNKNLVRANLLALTSSGLPGTAFPLACSGGTGRITLTTTFTAGDNNVFGPFTRTAVFSVDLGLRAPVVLGAAPVSGDATTTQVLTVTGTSFVINGVPNVTSVYAEQIDNPGNVVPGTFVYLDDNRIEATFDFGPSNAGKTFLIFVSGPNGTSRNLRTAVGSVPAGNEQGNLITFTTNAPPPPPPPDAFGFGVSSISVSEGADNVDITVTRTGNTSSAVTVDYATADGTATQKSDYMINLGQLRFAAGETSKTIKLLLVDDVFVEGNETLTINLSAPSGGFTAGGPITVTITDNDLVPPTSNPIDDPAFFIRQQYLDFLAREPDAIGFANWLATLTGCPNNGFDNTPGCDRIHVSSSFFLSQEFQERGYFIERFYEVSFGRRPTYLEFMKDISFIGGFSSPAEEAANKVIYADEFVLRPEFTAIYNGLSNTQFVDMLAATAGVTLTNRDALIADLNGATKTRAQVLREIVESSEVETKFFNTAFVLMQYFGYLRRDPDTIGFQNWLDTINMTGDFRHMVGGFINSDEYRLRFGPHP